MFILKIIIWVETLIASLIPRRMVVIDTETTGKHPGTDELLQVSIISGHGRVLFNHYLKPTNTLSWKDAQRINHISPFRVKMCPHISVYEPLISAILKKAKTIVGYNTEFDLDFLQSADIDIGSSETVDVMREDSDRRSGAKWRKLIKTAASYGYFFVPHGALEDCKATLHIYNRMYRKSDIAFYISSFALCLIRVLIGVGAVYLANYFQLHPYVYFIILALLSLTYGPLYGVIIGLATATILHTGIEDVLLLVGCGLALGISYKLHGFTHSILLKIIIIASMTFFCAVGCTIMTCLLPQESVLNIFKNSETTIIFVSVSPLYLLIKNVLSRLI